MIGIALSAVQRINARGTLPQFASVGLTGVTSANGYTAFTNVCSAHRVALDRTPSSPNTPALVRRAQRVLVERAGIEIETGIGPTVSEIAIACGVPQLSITDIATRAGFSHLGGFSQAYRRAFGETPSATCRKY
jgi:hypothetical protein